MSFQGKAVLITGASSGIGAAVAKQFAAEGAKVAIVGRNTEKLKKVEEDISKIGHKPKVIVAELTDDEDVNRIIDETIQSLGALDVLVNNAGMSRPTIISANNVIQLYDLIHETNLRAVVNLTHHALPHLISSKGNIVNISSVAALTTISGSFAYCTAKAGLDMFTKCMASDLGAKGIRVNSINAGPVRTDFIENMGIPTQRADQLWETAKKTNVLERVSDPQEIGDLVLFLASDKARGVTGSLYTSDNGYLVNKLTHIDN